MKPSVLFVAAALAVAPLAVSADDAPPATPAPPACAVPDQEAYVIFPRPPVEPPAAAQRAIYGDVVLRITLDDGSHVVAAAITKSPSSLLNEAAVTAARGSIFQTAMHNCAPVGGAFQFVVHFVNPKDAPQSGG